MLAGNCLSNILEIKDKGSIIKDVNKFLSSQSYDNTIDCINNYFTNYLNNSSIIPIEDGKYHIDLVTNQNDRFRIQYQSYRLNNKGKFMYILSFKKVNYI
jgi:hypothetical protein